ncbi:hypothetical protein CDD80_5383 [Ophiocordyceps camponoti-rufipedis]|uniref:Uncharacterized protein n=1 Tax=Ophiocordyceps camponoti-rufipedis TaxID=2004952 RepID=A0A2C5ZGS6_9HYPO|nr:hypothetical protein CDD80_5383 [Ophiocordyceps camponoti-rufipedis]
MSNPKLLFRVHRERAALIQSLDDDEALETLADFNDDPSDPHKIDRITGSVEDVDMSIKILGEALEQLTDPYAEARIHVISNATCALLEAENIPISREIPHLAKTLKMLFECRYKWFEKTQSAEHKEMTIEALNKVVNSVSDCTTRYKIWTMAEGLSYRFQLTGCLEDLDAAIEALADLVEDPDASSTTCKDNLTKIYYICRLAEELMRRLYATYSREGLVRLVTVVQEGCCCESDSPAARLRLALLAVHAAMSLGEWGVSHYFHKKALKLLPLVTARSLKHSDGHYNLGMDSPSGIISSSRAAALALNSGRSAQQALRLVELGRGVVASMLFEMHGDISQFREKHPDLTRESESLRDELGMPWSMEAASGNPSHIIGVIALAARSQRRRETESGSTRRLCWSGFGTSLRDLFSMLLATNSQFLAIIGLMLRGSKTVIDRVRSSYATTIKTLLQARRHHLIRGHAESRKAVLVAMEDTPDLGRLHHAVDEVNVVRDLCRSLKVDPITPSPHKDDVLRHLQDC